MAIDERNVFTVQARTRVFERALELAKSDARVIAGAEGGLRAVGEGDQGSDFDLTFAVALENQVIVVNLNRTKCRR
jgi:hypothetical protein